MRVVEMIPGYTHSITNLSAADDLVTVMWANEPFDPENPDTYYEEVLAEPWQRTAPTSTANDDEPFEADDHRGHAAPRSSAWRRSSRSADAILRSACWSHTGQNYDYTLNGIFFPRTWRLTRAGRVSGRRGQLIWARPSATSLPRAMR